MAVRLNRVYLAGNLTRDPQVRFFANERAVADFGLAMNRRYRGSDGEMKEEVTFVDVEAWGRTAELVGQYLTKGRACMIEGRLRLDTWDDKDGNRRTKLKVVAESVQFIDGRSGGRDDSSSDSGGYASRDGSGGYASRGESGGYASRGGDSGGYGSSSSAPAGSSADADDEPPF